MIFNKNKIYSINFIALLLILSSISKCNNPFIKNHDLPYAIKSPSAKYVLEHKLNEVSGLSFVSEKEVALIEDENGSIFYYDFITKKITRTILFAKDGDFEDLQVINDTVYIIKSDGTLFELKNFKGPKYGIVKCKYYTGLTKKNNAEGLCYDDKKKLLLIACKGKAGKIDSDEKYKNKKAIYSYNPETKVLSDTPVVLIDESEVRKHAYSIRKNAIENIIKFYTRTQEKSDFEPSGLAIQPITRDIYVISTVGKILVILEPDGKLKHVEKLAPNIFKQPEGIAFDSVGNMYISNEGRKGEGNILKFLYAKDNL